MMHETDTNIILLKENNELVNLSKVTLTTTYTNLGSHLKVIKFRSFHGNPFKIYVITSTSNNRIVPYIWTLEDNSICNALLSDLTLNRYHFSKYSEGLTINDFAMTRSRRNNFIETSVFLDKTTLLYYNWALQKFEIYDLKDYPRPKGDFTTYMNPKAKHSALSVKNAFNFVVDPSVSLGFYSDYQNGILHASQPELRPSQPTESTDVNAIDPIFII